MAGVASGWLAFTCNPWATNVAKKKPKKLTPQQLEHRRRLRSQRKRRAHEARFKELGLVDPRRYGNKTLPKKELSKLTKHWYEKLEKSGFSDIEWADNPDSQHIKRPASRARLLVPGKQLYYALCRNYLTHARWRGRSVERLAWKLHTEGLSYRQILKQVKSKHNETRSLFWLYYFVADTRKKCMQWNKTHAHGMLNPANQDSFASDVLINDWELKQAEEYGLKLETDKYSMPKLN